MKLHGVINYIDHHIENLKTCLFSDPNIKCSDSGESTIPKWHKTYARLNEVKSSLGCWGKSSSRVEAAAAAMTVRRANNFLAVGFSSSCSDAGWMEFAVCKIYDKMNKIYGRIDGWINENQYVERKKHQSTNYMFTAC